VLSGSKLPQNFKECNQVTTMQLAELLRFRFKATTKFQRMQSSHNFRLIVSVIKLLAIKNYLCIKKKISIFTYLIELK
jgi:hypothetical protein